MPYIKKCRAPDLSEFRTPVISEYAWRLVFQGAGTSDRRAGSFVINFILSVDKAVREYNAGRELLVEYAASSNRTSLLIEGLGRFETCINSTKRALRFIARQATHQAGPEVERLTRRLLRNHEKLITSIRDSIEHMDESVQTGELKEGEPHALDISPDSEFLEIASYRLSLASLAQILRHLRGLASELTQFQEPTARIERPLIKS
jgi:hypothetical protein